MFIAISSKERLACKIKDTHKARPANDHIPKAWT